MELEINNIIKNLIENLDCPVCFNKMECPITMCVNGHNICNQCKGQLNKCPLCRGAISSVRNLYAENASIIFVLRPCKFMSQGCQTKDFDLFMDKHENSCAFKNFECNISNSIGTCSNKSIGFAKFLKHMQAFHRLKGVENCFGATYANLPFGIGSIENLGQDRQYDPWMLNSYGKHFILMRKFTATDIYFWITGNISEEETCNYSGSISITNPMKTKKVAWAGPVHSFHSELNTDVAPQGCFKINRVTYLNCGEVSETGDLILLKHIFKVSPKLKVV